MYNLNGSMSGPPMLGVDGGSGGAAGLTVGVCGITPRTPEILNSVIAMTNPLEYSYSSTPPTPITPLNQSQQQVLQSSDSHSSCSGSPLDSPACGGSITSVTGTPTTISQKHTCSQLIKAGLKYQIEMKRKPSTGDSSGAETSSNKMRKEMDSSDDEEDLKSPKSGVSLTAEDEDRRRRRRERNKIAATKCRMKKRERTLNLVTEAENLEKQNIYLKSEVLDLEKERRKLTDMLHLHGTACIRPDGFQLPICNISIEKYLNDIGLAPNQTITSGSNGIVINSTAKAICDQTKNKNLPVKLSQTQKIQKIPPMNTLKFSCRRSNQQQQPQHNIQSPLECVTALTSSPTTTTTRCIQTPINTTNIDCKPLPSMDMGYCEDPNEMLTQNGNYCKSLISSSVDCYTISSPDSGFIKSPVDIGNYGNLQATIVKTDYIPNCDSTASDLEHASQLALSHTLDDCNDNNNGDGTMEFILKSELADGSDSPYTTVQSADRFLFDGTPETYEQDIDASIPNQNHLPGDHQTLLPHHHTDLHHNSLKEHHLLQNNNNQNHINNNNTVNVITTTPTTNNSIIEYNNSPCQQYIESSLLKGDFCQNGEFITLTSDGIDTQFTDLDSGITTYTNMTNGSGCLA